MNEDRQTRLLKAIRSKKINNPELLHGRLSWYRDINSNFDPIFCHILDDDEIDILAEWFADTTNRPFLGEVGFPLVSNIAMTILTNRITSVVQLGSYAGFSSLVIGMILRKVDANSRLVSFDIDNLMTNYCNDFIRYANLDTFVHHFCLDSSDITTTKIAGKILNSQPQLLFIDASKQYQNTLNELKIWSPHIYGYVVVHDVSKVATENDINESRGVGAALVDSRVFEKNQLLILDPHTELNSLFPYADPCGIGIGLLNGKTPLPTSDVTIADLQNGRAICPAIQLKYSENWSLDNCFVVSQGSIQKVTGSEGFARCFAPIKAGEKIKFKIFVDKISGGTLEVCAGGNPGTVSSVSEQGAHEGFVICGSENSIIALYGSSDVEFKVSAFHAYL